MEKNTTVQADQNKTTEPIGKDYKRTNLELAFLKLLYHEPLYESVDKDVRDINVLVIGWNEASKAFVDQCLSVGQMRSHYINIAVMTANPSPGADIGNYKGERPALADFINMYYLQEEKIIPSKDDDPYQDSPKEMYGDLYLMTYPEGADAETLLSSFPDKNGEYNYIVVARRDEEDNRNIADSLVSELDKRQKKDCKVCYVVHNKKSACRKKKEAVTAPVPIPVYVPWKPAMNRIDEDLVDEELDRMAFNAHILWGSFSHKDYQEAYRTFRNPKKDSDNSEDLYFYSSSVALAASIRYKLADTGIVWGDFKSMAAEFEKNATDNEQLLNELITLEHRRWLIDMATNGWSAPEKSMSEFCDDCCKRKKVNDYQNKIHPCMVRSSGTPSVSSGTEYGNDRKKWDEVEEGCSDEEKARFDELDQMSLSIHRAMHKKAKDYRDSRPLERDGSGPAASLGAYFKQIEDPQLHDRKREWHRYLFCIKNVLDGNAAYSDQYPLYYDRFRKSLDKIDNEQAEEELKHWAEEIDSCIWPVLQSNRYIDYKNNDRKLIRGISFILTYSTGWTLALPVHIKGETLKNPSVRTRPILNVASAAVIRPAKIVYLSYISNDQIDDLKETVKNCENLFKDKNINCPVKVCVALSDSGPEGKVTEAEDSPEDDTGKVSYDFKVCSNDKKAENYFQNCLSIEKADLYDERTSPFPSINTAEDFNHKITYIKRLHSFEFDVENKSFESCDETSACLNYIEKDAYLNAEEMFNLAGLKEEKFNYPYLERPEICALLWDMFIGKAYTTGKDNDPEAGEPAADDGINLWDILTKTLSTCYKAHNYKYVTEEEFSERLRSLNSQTQLGKLRNLDKNKADEAERKLERYFEELIDEKILVEKESEYKDYKCYDCC